MSKKEIVGVITGDLINSSQLIKGQKENILSRLGEFLDNNEHVILPIQFYRGDSFQLMVRAEYAAFIAIIIEAILLSETESLSRISIGIGTVSKIVSKTVLESEGEAFLLSGHQLDKMKAEGRIFKVALISTQFQPLLSATFHVVETIIKGWKSGQAAVIAAIPFCKNQKEIAQRLNISDPAVSKALKSAQWSAIDDFINGFEVTIKNLKP